MTLTETAQLTKRGFVVFIIILFGYLTSQAVWARVKDTLFPPKIPPPEVAFGKLPSLQIPTLPFKEGSDPEYIIDTKTGRLPTNLPDRADVYKIILPTVTHLVSQQAKDLASKLGFSEDMQKISSSEYRWEDSDEGRVLNMNITTENFKLETDIKNLANLPTGSPPSKAAAAEQAKRFLQGLGVLSDDYAAGRQEAAYLKVVGGSLVGVENFSEAQLTRVDFFREIEEQPVVGQHPYRGLISVVLAKEATPFVSYNYWPLDPLQSTSYPLRTVEQVWQEVEAGQARLVFLAPAKADPFSSYEPQAPRTIYVHQISLGYFDSEKLQDYLQPIYVLEGLGITADRRQLEFIAYLPAIADEWVVEK